MSSYLYYTSEVGAAFKQQHHEATVQQLSRLMRAGWKSLSAEDKVKFQGLAAKDKDRYLAEKAAWDKLHLQHVAADDDTKVQYKQDQEDSDDDFEPVAKPKRQRQDSCAKLKNTHKGRDGGAIKRKKKTTDGGQVGGSQPVGGDEDTDSDLEVCLPTMSQYNMQKDSVDRPVAWEGTNLTGSKLHSLVWARIVLDEAHKIKGRTTNVAKSIYALRSEYKWALTGTPLQNNVGELWGLVRFLKMQPWAYYFWCVEPPTELFCMLMVFSGTPMCHD
jgi:DNA repair protein RAD16